MTSRDAILATLRRDLPDLHKRYGVSSLSLFGSFARGDESESSDVDLLADFDRTIGLFKFCELIDDLEESLGRKVDVVMRSELRPFIRERAEADEIRI